MPLQRQKEMVKQLYSETMALEELLEEAVNTLGPDARDILLQIRCASARLSRGDRGPSYWVHASSSGSWSAGNILTRRSTTLRTSHPHWVRAA